MKTGSRSLNQSREALQTKGKVNGRFLVWLFVFSVAANLFLLAMPLYLAQIYDRVLPSSSFETLIYLTAIILVCLALFGVMEVLRSKIAQRLSTHYEMTTAPAILNRSIESRDAIASQQSALFGDVTMIRQLLASRAFIALFDLPFTPLFLLLLFVVHPWLGWVATAGAIMLVTLALCNEALARNRNGQSAQTQQIAKQKGAEILIHLEDVRAMAMGQALYERWRKTALQTALSADQVASLNGFFFGLVRFSRQAIQVAILGTGAYLVLTQSMSAGLIFAASIIGGRALMPIEQLLGSWRQLSSARQASKRVKNALSFYEQQVAGQNQPLRLPQLKGYLQVSRVSYVPEGLEDDKAILKNINFARHPGSILAILGASGAGKSTLMRILATSQHQSHGAVLFDMFQADHWSVNQLGKSIGYAGQSSDLFEGSVAENIARFDPEATDEDILQAANHAGAHDFIGSLPDGYHTQLG
ncbi:MAG: ATP-binding cassette domain-containing protein, partial [Cohaesibacter sp.]|nr:ATP-binding cassette domain-containing protein [Cohaesibacter sp.]